MWGRASSAPQGSVRFAERRRLRRRRTTVALVILLLLLLSAAIYGLHRPEVRISHVEIIGADGSLSASALEAMQGNYLGLIPRDSIFVFPADQIRADILKTHNDIAAVSIVRTNLTSISIKINNRVPIARWCGSTPDATRSDLNATSSRSDLVASCYLFDASGFIYATTSDAQPINSFVLYESMGEGRQASLTTPIGLTLSNVDKLPSVFDFARQLVTLGSAVVKMVIHDGEVDDYVESGTRVSYVLGNEQNAYTALVSARDNFNLSDGSVDYVDLRFDGKVYVKRK